MRTCLTELHTASFAAEREWTVEGIPVLTASVEVPQPQGTDTVSRRIRRYYQTQCRAYLRYCQRWLLPQAEAEYRAALAASAPLPCFRAELGYRVTYNEGGLWSLYTQSREITLPGGHLGPYGRLSHRPVRLFPRPRSVAPAAPGPGGGGHPAPGALWRGPLRPGLAEKASPPLQSPELLSDRRRPYILFPYVHHRSGSRGHSRLHTALRPAGPASAR